MSELDPLEGVTREAGRGVAPPSFDELAAVSQRRRRTTVLGAGAAVAVVIAVVGAGVRIGYDDKGAPVPPSKSPHSTHATSPPAQRDRAGAIVDSLQARRFSMAVLPE